MIPLQSFQNSCNMQSNISQFKIALLIPMSGTSGLWGPSAIASAETAMQEINNHKGIFSCEMKLVYFDAAKEALDRLLPKLEQQISEHQIDAIIGMHISSVYQKIVNLVAGRIPYIYTPSFEGGRKQIGTFSIGEQLKNQITPSIKALSKKRKVKKWALIGNSHAWPRSSHYYAHKAIKEVGSEIVMERFFDFDFTLEATLFDDLKASKADAVLISLLGQDAINFNREFGAQDMHRSMIRLSGIIEENCLLAIGNHNTKNLYSTSGYFSSLTTDANLAFKESYAKTHQKRAPMLNTLGQSLYEGLHFLTALIDEAQKNEGIIGSNDTYLRYQSVRNGVFHHDSVETPIYLAYADGMSFNVEETLVQ